MITKEELRHLQMAVLDIYKSFAEICKKYELTYYLNGGCMIGALRHGGFIPWDDDMDIVMPRPDYNKLINILNSSNDFPFIVNHYSSDVFTSGAYILKLCNPAVRYGKKSGEKVVVNDSFLSVFPLNGIPKSKIRQFIFENEVKLRYIYLRCVRSTHNGLETDKHGIKEKMGICFNKLLKIGKNVSVAQAAKQLDDCLQRYDYDLSDEVCEYSYGIAPFVWKRQIYGKPKTVTFEGIEIPAPTKYKEYLYRQYGDYMVLPPVEKQVPRHIDFVLVK